MGRERLGVLRNSLPVPAGGVLGPRGDGDGAQRQCPGVTRCPGGCEWQGTPVAQDLARAQSRPRGFAELSPPIEPDWKHSVSPQAPRENQQKPQSHGEHGGGDAAFA